MKAGKRLIYSETVCIFPLLFATLKRNLESRRIRFEKGIVYHEGKRRVIIS